MIIYYSNTIHFIFMISNEEIRSFRRMHLIETLAKELPEETIHFGCQVSAITQDPDTSYPIIHFDDGTTMKSKVKSF